MMSDGDDKRMPREYRGDVINCGELWGGAKGIGDNVGPTENTVGKGKIIGLIHLGCWCL